MYKVALTPGKNTSLELAIAMMNSPKSDIVIEFAPGKYKFSQDYASESCLNISNHGMNKLIRTGIPVINHRNVIVEGNGAELEFDGFINPILIDRSENVVVRNMTINMTRSLNLEGVVVAVTPEYVTLELSYEDAAALKIDRGQLQLKFGGELVPLLFSTIRFKPDGQLAAGSHDTGIGAPILDTTQELNGNLLTFRGAISAMPELKDTVAIRFGARYAPSIFVLSSRDVFVENVTIHDAAGMGVIGQKSSNISLNNVRVVPKAGRMSSLAADATHFVGCAGTLDIKNCEFRAQLDDPINIHNIYMQADMKIGARTLLLRLVHQEQYGVEVFKPGDKVSFINHDTLLSIGTSTVSSVKQINIEYAVVEFEDCVPGNMRDGDCVENLREVNVTIENCAFKNSRARGPLISCRGSVVMRGCDIDVTGAGVKISGDANYWFESGAVTRVLIENNTFNLCGRNPGWGDAGINIDPEIKPEFRGAGFYHGEIVIRGNKFITDGRPAVRGYCVRRVVLDNNEIIGNGGIDLTFCEKIETI